MRSPRAFITTHLNLIADQLRAKSGHSMACRKPQMDQIVAAGHLSGWQNACSHGFTTIWRVPILPSLPSLCAAASWFYIRSAKSDS